MDPIGERPEDRTGLKSAGAVSAGRFLDAGAETATAAAAGAKVAILDRDGDAASRVAVEIPGAGHGVIGLFFHVEVEEQVQTAAERALRLMGHCKVFVDNAVAC
jgi:NAD(P)-dependent dehydrogenase (short-subunit alcohol dehydrogenase family)